MILATLSLLAAPVKVAPISVNELYRMSSLIVFAEVTNVRKVSGLTIATADVKQTYKGKAKGKSIDFVAEPTWTCDISTAVKGERVLLYLDATNIWSQGTRKPFAELAAKYFEKDSALYEIGHSGRGRLPVKFNKANFVVDAYLGNSDKWNVNLELFLPNSKFVQRTVKDKGIIRVNDLVAFR